MTAAGGGGSKRCLNLNISPIKARANIRYTRLGTVSCFQRLCILITCVYIKGSYIIVLNVFFEIC